jgi:hypothetical protein
VIILSRAVPWLARRQGRQAMRGISRRAADEPLARIVGWALVGSGCVLWMLATSVLSPGIEDGVIAAEGWLATALGGPLLAASTLLRRRGHADLG